MPNRMLRDWTQSDKMNNLSVEAERFFTRLIMKVDDFGCFYADVRLLKANLFPLILDNIKSEDVIKWIDECKKESLITVYNVDGKEFLQIINFGQRLDKARAKFPMPQGDESTQGGYIYLMDNPENNTTKIGFSLNPWARLKEIQKISGDSVVLRMYYKGTIYNETEVHKLLRKYNYEKEWFKLPKNIVSLFTTLYEEKKSADDIIVALRSKSYTGRTPAELEVERNLKTEAEGTKVPTHTLEEIDSFEKFKEWINKNAPTVSKMKEPFTIVQYLKLKEKLPKDVVKALLLAMQNYKPLLQKSVSAYLTILNWSKRENNNGLSEQKTERSDSKARDILNG